MVIRRIPPLPEFFETYLDDLYSLHQKIIDRLVEFGVEVVTITDSIDIDLPLADASIDQVLREQGILTQGERLAVALPLTDLRYPYHYHPASLLKLKETVAREPYKYRILNGVLTFRGRILHLSPPVHAHGFSEIGIIRKTLDPIPYQPPFPSSHTFRHCHFWWYW